MPATTPCTPCCATTQVVNVPGSQGLSGQDGADGINAFAFILNDPSFVVPAIGANVTVTVDSSLGFVVGQTVIVAEPFGATLGNPGPAHFTVAAIPTATSLTLTKLNFPGDVAPGASIDLGAGVSPSGESAAVADPLPVANGGTGGATAAAAITNLGLSSATNAPYTSIGSGAAYVVTNAAAKITMGSGDITVTVTRPGTYLIFGFARFDYNGATFAAVRTVTQKLRRINNTPADLLSGQWLTEIITTLDYTAHVHHLPVLIYTTANNDDTIELWSDVSVAPTAGSLDVVEASIIAIKLY